MEQRVYLIICLMIECEDLPFAVYDKTKRYRLHTSGGELRLDLSPEYRRELESHESVEHAACLLCVHETHVDVARILYRIEDGVLCNLMEHDSSGVRCVKVESFEKMP